MANINEIHDLLTENEIKSILELVNKYGTENPDMDRVKFRRDLDKLVYNTKLRYNLSISDSSKETIVYQIKKLLNKL